MAKPVLHETEKLKKDDLHIGQEIKIEDEKVKKVLEDISNKIQAFDLTIKKLSLENSEQSNSLWKVIFDFMPELHDWEITFDHTKQAVRLQHKKGKWYDRKNR